METGRVETRGYAFEKAIVLFDAHAAARGVAGCTREAGPNRDWTNYRQDFTGIVDRAYEGSQQRFARDAASAGKVQRSGDRREIRRKTGVMYVDADTCDHGIAFKLRKDARAFLAVEQHIVGPAQIGREAGCFSDGLLRGESEGEHHHRECVAIESAAQYQRDVQARPGLTMPGVPVTSYTLRLSFPANTPSLPPTF